MGYGNDMLVDSMKKNLEEVARKQKAGEKLSAGNIFGLVIHIGLLLCTIAFSFFIIKFIVQVML